LIADNHNGYYDYDYDYDYCCYTRLIIPIQRYAIAEQQIRAIKFAYEVQEQFVRPDTELTAQEQFELQREYCVRQELVRRACVRWETVCHGGQLMQSSSACDLVVIMCR
jgi:hypothetical protein